MTNRRGGDKDWSDVATSQRLPEKAKKGKEKVFFHGAESSTALWTL